jgi:hypothetical protein
MAQKIRLSEAHIALIQSGVAILVAAADVSLRSTVTFGLGCRVASARDRITIFVAPSKGQALLENVRQSHAIAVVFCQASTHVTLQLKGHRPVIRSLTDAEQQVLPAYLDRFVEDLAHVGEEEVFVRTLMWHADADIIAIDFDLTAVFSQTPGPQAGSLLQA